MNQENHSEDLNEFREYGKTHRLFREVVMTEKIDGSNGCVVVLPDGTVRAGSRNRWLIPGKSTDNFGFADWVQENAPALATLGPGRHFGEWWGSGIQRGYGQAPGVRHFSLFNSSRWNQDLWEGDEQLRYQRELVLAARKLCIPEEDLSASQAPAQRRFVAPPACCLVVPILFRGTLDTSAVWECVRELEISGSVAAPGFMNPEGIIVYHTHAGMPFKVTCHGDQPKGAQE